MDGKIWVVVKIAEQCDGEAIHALRPARKRKIPAHNKGKVRLQQERIAGDSQRANGCG
jgi:hypothetical protein